MINETDLYYILRDYDYDLRKSNNGRWIDQKCTPDVLCIIADCIYEYVSNDWSKSFSATDIWRNEYTHNNVLEIFNKPSTENELSRNEYDKFFSQPLEMLANARVLNKVKKGNRNFYTVNEIDLLEYIALREKNAYKFIVDYCEKVMVDSEIWFLFEDFFSRQTTESYFALKESFEIFIIRNTPINGKVEVRRIFTKVLNPLACARKKKGTYRGRFSTNIITYAELMYNRENFRDANVNKPKSMTREEWNFQRREVINTKYFKYQSQKAKKFLRKFNDQYNYGQSECNDEYSNGIATQIHHIFPEHTYPEISMYLENLIALTPTQHMNKAHPNNNTHRIDTSYQELLLKSKAGSIETNINDANIETIYDFNQFIEVLNTGFNTCYEVYDNDFNAAMSIITDYYLTV